MQLRPSIDALISHSQPFFPLRSFKLAPPIIVSQCSAQLHTCVSRNTLLHCRRPLWIVDCTQRRLRDPRRSSSIKPHPFSTTCHLNKGQRHKNRGAEESEQHSRGGQRTSRNAELAPISEATELVALKSEIRRIHDKFRKSISVLKAGGQFNLVFLETLRVDLTKLRPTEDVKPVKSHEKPTMARWVKNDPSTHEEQPSQNTRASKKKGIGKHQTENRPPSAITQPLKELAQVIPRGGKTAMIVLDEEDFIKPVTSALLSSPYSLNPQPSATNPLELIVPIPPPSAETRQWNAGQVDKYLERADADLREGRAEMQKTLRSLHVAGQLGPDAHRKTQKDMEKVVDEAKTELKRMCDAWKRASA